MLGTARSKNRTKNFLMEELNKMLREFGFCDIHTLLQSLFRLNIWGYLAALNAGIAFIINLTGMEPALMSVFMLLLVAELFSGIGAAKLNKRKIRARPLQRFALKIFVYIVILSLLNNMALHYKQEIIGKVYDEIYDFILLYIISVYIISIFENLDRMDKSQGRFKDLIKGLKDITKRIIGITDKPKEKGGENE